MLRAASDPANERRTDYVYDGLNRLRQEVQYPSWPAATPTLVCRVAYDPSGNVTAVTDASGRVARLGYDALDRLTSVTYDDGSTPGVTTPTVAYSYDGDGLRVRQSTGGVTSRLVYDVAAGLPGLLDDAVQQVVWRPTGPAYAVDASGGIAVLHPDGLGSIRALSGATGQVVQTYGTDAFGAPDPALMAGSATQPLQYTGEPRLPNSGGLVDLRARVYEPSSGRFLQRDPFGGFGSDPGSLNPYVYVGNNPATLTDPTGQNPLLAACAVGAAGSVLVDVGLNLATGRKVTGSQVLQSAGSGCVFGLVGFGAGKVAGQVVAKLFGSTGAEAEALASQAATCLANSFTPETRVLTETGERPIGEVAIGERVWAWDEQTGAAGWRTVTATIQSSDPAVVVLRIAGQELRATPEHPFYARSTDEDGWSWIAAGQLRVGDRVRTASGTAATVEGVRVEPGLHSVVNLEVEGAHTFYVGDAQVLVHNANTTAKNPACKTYQTYTKTNPVTGEVYVGRTSGLGTPLVSVQ